MGRLNGIGERKLELYGDQFLELIRDYQAEQKNPHDKDLQVQESVTLYRSGMTVAQVAKQQHLSENVIYNHLADGIAEGQIPLADVVELSADQLRQIQQIMCECMESFGVALKPVHEALDGLYEYGVLRCIRADMERVEQGG